MSGIKCFFIENTNVNELSLRRYASLDSYTCPGTGYYHNAMTVIAEMPDGDTSAEVMDHSDPRWPTKCEGCDYQFGDNDPWQNFYTSIYKNGDNRYSLNDLPSGAMFYCDWMIHDLHNKGPDGHSLAVQTPGGLWMIDSRANNCTMPDDWEHKCWVRHGTVPNITVDKTGHTCGAGAGSILQGNYHGFLRDGYLVPA